MFNKICLVMFLSPLTISQYYNYFCFVHASVILSEMGKTKRLKCEYIDPNILITILLVEEQQPGLNRDPSTSSIETISKTGEKQKREQNEEAREKVRRFGSINLSNF